LAEVSLSKTLNSLNSPGLAVSDDGSGSNLLPSILALFTYPRTNLSFCSGSNGRNVPSAAGGWKTATADLAEARLAAYQD
jgi:hypothetical protein